MVEYQSGSQSYVVKCTHCGGLALVTTVHTDQRAKEIAMRWGWKLQTDLGDLCPKCDGLRQFGLL